MSWEGQWRTRWPWGPVRRLRLVPRGHLPFATGKFEAVVEGKGPCAGDFSVFDATSQPILELAGLGLFAVVDVELDPTHTPRRLVVQRWSPSHGPHGRAARLER